MHSSSNRAAVPAPVLVLHGVANGGSRPDEEDTLIEVREVSASLHRLGLPVIEEGMSGDLDALMAVLDRTRPCLVFNLVEAISGSDALLPVAALVLEARALSYTGAPAAALAITNDKRQAKRLLRRAGIATPETVCPSELGAGDKGAERWIVKAALAHASLGLDSRSVVDDPADLATRLAEQAALHGGPWFAERFIEGREFSVSLLDLNGAPRLLPMAEIEFTGFAAGEPRLVGYAAKWDPGSPQYWNTEPRSTFDDRDAPLLAELGRIALECWELFGLRGYARVDFRVDAAGRPWVLEINANPCLSPGAGFAAAAFRAGLNYDQTVNAIVQAGRASAPSSKAPMRETGTAPGGQLAAWLEPSGQEGGAPTSTAHVLPRD